MAKSAAKIVAASRQPDGRWIGLRGKAEFAEQANGQKLSFFVPDFAQKIDRPWLLAEESFVCSDSEFAELLGSNLPIHMTPTKEPSYAGFLKVHESILEKIASGVLKKAVPAVLQELSFSGSLEGGLHSLMTSESKLWPYGFAIAEEGMIGLTPEILFTKSGLLLKTQAVAGTRLIQGSSLLNDSKEMLEHQLVIEDITSQFTGLGEIEIGETTERAAGILKHLVTDIKVKLFQDIEFLDLAERLHPTAALGGFPRTSAKKWLADQSEFLLRKRFGAPFGWRFPNGDGICLVAIRNVQWQGSQAWIGSGCGVVKGSVADQEWQELALKRLAIVNALEVKL